MNETIPSLPTTLLTGEVDPFITFSVTVYPSVKSTTQLVGKFTVVSIIFCFSVFHSPTDPFVHVTVLGMYGSLSFGKLIEVPFSVALANTTSPFSLSLYGFVPDPFTFTSLCKYITGLKLLVVLASVIFPFVIFLTKELSIT